MEREGKDLAEGLGPAVQPVVDQALLAHLGDDWRDLLGGASKVAVGLGLDGCDQLEGHTGLAGGRLQEADLAAAQDRDLDGRADLQVAAAGLGDLNGGQGGQGRVVEDGVALGFDLVLPGGADLGHAAALGDLAVDELGAPDNEGILPVRVVQGLEVAPLVADLGAEDGVEHARDAVGVDCFLVGVDHLDQVLTVKDGVFGQADGAVSVGRVVAEAAHRIDGFLGPLGVPLLGLDLVQELGLGHVEPTEDHSSGLDVGGLGREDQLVVGRQGCDHGLVRDHGGNGEIALALGAQVADGLEGPALAQVGEGRKEELRGLVVGLGVGDEVGQVGQDGVRGRLGGQGHDLVHGQVLLALSEFLLPGDVDAGPAVGPEVLGEQLNLTGEVIVHLRIDRPVHQVVRGDGLVELADVGGADAEH